MTQRLTHCMASSSPAVVLHGRSHQRIAGNRVSVTQEREQEEPLNLPDSPHPRPEGGTTCVNLASGRCVQNAYERPRPESPGVRCYVALFNTSYLQPSGGTP